MRYAATPPAPATSPNLERDKIIMSWMLRYSTDPVQKSRRGLREFEARGITMPDTVHTALAALDRVDSERPTPLENSALHDAIVAGADRAEIDRLLLIDSTHQRHLSAWTTARKAVGQRVINAILGARDTLHEQLRAVADEQISKLEQVAALGPAATLDAVVRSGDTAGARLLADVDLHAAELQACVDLRNMFLTPPGAEYGVGHVSCGEWRDPTRIDGRLHGATFAENYQLGLQAGGQLWLPTAEEATAAAQPIHTRQARHAQQVAQKQRHVGGLAAFG